MQDLQRTILNNPRVSWDNNTSYKYSIEWTWHIDLDNSNTTVRRIADISRANRSEINNIKNYLSLAPNWDSYEAAAIPTQSVEKAIAFITETDKYGIDVYTSSPGPNGEILVHLKLGKREIEFLFYPDKSKYVLFANNEFENQGTYKMEILTELIEWLRNDA